MKLSCNNPGDKHRLSSLTQSYKGSYDGYPYKYVPK